MASEPLADNVLLCKRNGGCLIKEISSNSCVIWLEKLKEFEPVLPESFCQKKRRTPKITKNRHFTPKKRKKRTFWPKITKIQSSKKRSSFFRTSSGNTARNRLETGTLTQTEECWFFNTSFLG